MVIGLVGCSPCARYVDSDLPILGGLLFSRRGIHCVGISCFDGEGKVGRALMGFWFTGFGRLVVGRRGSVFLDLVEEEVRGSADVEG